jgi:hypothetical protein
VERASARLLPMLTFTLSAWAEAPHLDTLSAGQGPRRVGVTSMSSNCARRLFLALWFGFRASSSRQRSTPSRRTSSRSGGSAFSCSSLQLLPCRQFSWPYSAGRGRPSSFGGGRLRRGIAARPPLTSINPTQPVGVGDEEASFQRLHRMTLFVHERPFDPSKDLLSPFDTSLNPFESF